MREPKLRPVCFMVMPLGIKPVAPRPANAPETIDFDALWNKALAAIAAELQALPPPPATA